ncbi:toxin, partial [Staphylococcus aureus]
MYLYEKMVIENKEIPIDDGKSLGNFEGFYDNGVILINKNLSERRKAEVLYEELAHH